MEDMRYQRTEKLIEEVVKKLLLKKGIDEIKITEICSMANISRNAFYGHYYDKYDMIGKMTVAFFQELKDGIFAIRKDAALDELNEHAIEHIVWYFDNNKELLSMLEKNDRLFWYRFQSAMMSLLFNNVPKDPRHLVYAEFCSGGMCVCLESYYSGRVDLKRQEFISSLTEIIKKANEFRPSTHFRQ